MDTLSTQDRITKALSFLRSMFAPDDWIEIRLLPLGASRWFQHTDDAEAWRVMTWAAERNGRERDPDNVYFGVHARRESGKRGDANVVPEFSRLIADWDGTSIDDAVARCTQAGLPQMNRGVFSGGGTHGYWFLEEPIKSVDVYRSLIKGIAAAVGSDKCVHNPERLLRLPGFDNVKPDRPGRPLCCMERYYDAHYKLDQFPAKEIRPRKTTREKKPPRGRLCDDGQRFMQTGELVGERRPALFRIACDMQARGWELGHAVEAIMAKVPLIKPPLPQEDIDDLPRQIENAFKQEREPGYEASRAEKAVNALVLDASAGEAFSGGTDLLRPSTYGDVGLSRRLAKTIRGRLAYVREWQMWVAFDGKRWSQRADHIAVQECKRLHDELWREIPDVPPEQRMDAVFFVKGTATKRCIDAVVSLARSEPGINVSQNEFDAHPWLLNVQNGVLDLRSGDLLPHDPSLRLTQLAPVSYDPDAKSNLWQRFMRDVTCGDDDIENFLQQSFGTALTGDVSDEVLFCHNGGGCNGKSTALEAMAAMLGDYAAVAPPGLFTARNFDSHPTEIAALHGKRFVTAIEQEANRALRESLVKSLTGGDTIRTRRMREDFWEMKPTWKIHIAYNRAPRLTGTDDGIRRRLRVVPWAASFKDRPDPTIKQRLVGESERSGILTWCLEGLRRWLAAGRLESPPAVLVATDEYIDDEDLIGRFIADRCVEGPLEQLEIRSALAAFRAWMVEDGAPRHVIDGYTANLLGRELARRNFIKCRPDSGVFRKRVIYKGLSVSHACEVAQSGEDWNSPFHR
jgi:P4 family phage/plasmid primase-like protien